MEAIGDSRVLTKSFREDKRGKEWYERHMVPCGVVEKTLFQVYARVLRVISFFSPAPDVEGIHPKHQERNYFRLIRLRIGQIFQAHLDFQDEKKLILSDRLSFYQNTRIGQPLCLEIDEPLRELVDALNDIPELYVFDSCSGHVFTHPDDTDQCVCDDHGFVGFAMEYYNRAAQYPFFEELRALCKKFSEGQNEFHYQLREQKGWKGRGFFSLYWHGTDAETRTRYYILRKELASSRLSSDVRRTLESELFSCARKTRDSIERNQASHEQFLKEAVELVRKYANAPLSSDRYTSSPER